MIIVLLILLLQLDRLHSIATTTTSKTYKVICQWKISPNNNNDNNDISSFLHQNASDIFPSITSSKKAIRKGLVLINNLKANNENNRIINVGDIITYHIPISYNNNDRKNSIDFEKVPIVYEDDYFAIVIKPQGMSVFTSSNKHVKQVVIDNVDDDEDDDEDDEDIIGIKNKYSLSTNVLYQLNMESKTDPNIHMLSRPIPVHRLDRDTYGLVIVAKTKVALKKLSQMFSDRAIKKKYRAIVIGKTDHQSGNITSNIDGKQANTEYINVMSINTPNDNSISVVDLYPNTGRKHQLRKHMKEIGNPILNDPKYCFNHSLILKQKEMMLFAIGLTFNHPITNTFINISIPEPSIYNKVLEKLIVKPKQYYTYLLQSSDGSSYVGTTTDVDRRLRQHNRDIKGGAFLTGIKVYRGQKWNRVCSISGYPNWEDALRFEWSWKYHSKAKKMLSELDVKNKIEIDKDKEKKEKKEKIINPYTNKQITVGGTTWKKLVLAGLIPGFLPEMLIWRLSPLERRMRALKKVMNLERPTKKALSYKEWNNDGPIITWDCPVAKKIYDNL